MTEAEVIRVTRKHVEGLFPKTCRVCQRIYPNYHDYLLTTERVGVPLSYDLEANDLKPKDSHGNIALANCPCGNTLAISSSGMPLLQIWQILLWVRNEAKQRKVKVEDIICYLRDTVEAQALAEEKKDRD